MAKILTFRNKDGAGPDQDFLTDGADKLSFRTGDDGAVSLDAMPEGSLPDVMPDPNRDWRNQELADLFRVRQLLSGAGVSVDTLRGVTDEGDPWFVYCHLNGDVFIHMARIDGAYVLDSPNVHRPLRGRDFNELIADFTSDVLPARGTPGAADGTTEQRVIRLERGGKVRLHPSAMLAALIWTLFMASEELVMLASEGEELSEADALLDFAQAISIDGGAPVLATESAAQEDFAADAALRTEQGTDEAAAHHSTPDTQGQMREVMAQQGLAMHQNAFAMGLSTIAIAMGFMSEAVLLDNQRKVLEGLKTLGFTQYAAAAEGGPELEQIAGEGGDALLEMLAEFLGLDLSLNTETAAAPADGTRGTDPLGQDAQLVTGVLEDATALPAQKPVQTVAREDEDTDLAAPAAKASQDIAPAQDTLIAMTIAAHAEAEAPSMSDLLGNNQQMEEFQLGQTTVMASFDLTKADQFALSDFLFIGQRTDHRSFDDRAQDFIDYVQAKETEVGIVTIGNEIIMIDRSAFQHTGAETYTFSWETNTGQVISMIGLRSEFQEFDLIA